MPKMRSVKVVKESDTGSNKKFKDTDTGRYMDKAQFVKAIEKGTYSNYHVRNINGVKTPASNPDGTKSNNLD